MSRFLLALSALNLAMGSALAAAPTPVPMEIVDDTPVVGEVQHPEIDIVISKEKLVAEPPAKLDESFVPKIAAATEQRVF